MFDLSKCPVESTEITPEIKKMPAPVIRGLATTVRSYAEELERIANDAESNMRERLKMVHHRKKLDTANLFIGQLIEDGVEPAAAINRAAHRFHIADTELSIIWPTFRRKIKTTAMINRTRQVMLLHRHGLTQEEIGDKMNLSERQIRRIIKAEFDALKRL